jgi:hypothetical protein
MTHPKERMTVKWRKMVEKRNMREKRIEYANQRKNVMQLVNHVVNAQDR